MIPVSEVANLEKYLTEIDKYYKDNSIEPAFNTCRKIIELICYNTYMVENVDIPKHATGYNNLNKSIKKLYYPLKLLPEDIFLNIKLILVQANKASHHQDKKYEVEEPLLVFTQLAKVLKWFHISYGVNTYLLENFIKNYISSFKKIPKSEKWEREKEIFEKINRALKEKNRKLLPSIKYLRKSLQHLNPMLIKYYLIALGPLGVLYQFIPLSGAIIGSLAIIRKMNFSSKELEKILQYWYKEATVEDQDEVQSNKGN